MSIKGYKMRLGYKVKLLSDVVLFATSNNEGNRKTLEYLPGSLFLGVVAKHYDFFKDKFLVFHSGKVRFKDAHLIIENQLSYKIPFSFYCRKFAESEIYNFHLLGDTDFKRIGQIKQIRSGFMNSNFQKESIEYSYRQKSAYDKEKRRSKDSSMYGYRAIKKGSEFYFEIEIDEIDGSDLELLKTSIKGIKQIGKSKSSEYGLVEIIPYEIKENIENEITSNEVYLYANSRISLIDKNGNLTYDLEYLFDGIKKENIDYHKSQIRYGSYTPFNSIRNRDSERIFIEKGSVIVLKNITNIPKKVGVFLSEGFGDILVNPSFLLKKEIEFKKSDYSKTEERIKITLKTAKILQNRKTKKSQKIENLRKVSEFIKHHKALYKDISSSQWGAIRKIVISNDNFKDAIREFVLKGVKKWKDNQVETLLNINANREFYILLATQFAKETT